jgi:hypothetical protein
MQSATGQGKYADKTLCLIVRQQNPALASPVATGRDVLEPGGMPGITEELLMLRRSGETLCPLLAEIRRYPPRILADCYHDTHESTPLAAVGTASP